MDQKEYKRIKAFCGKHLHHCYHGRFFDDCVQYVALQKFLNPKKNLKHALIDFCIKEGLINGEGRCSKRNMILSKAVMSTNSDIDNFDEFIENNVENSYKEYIEYDEKDFILDALEIKTKNDILKKMIKIKGQMKILKTFGRFYKHRKECLSFAMGRFR